jgi:hypothetical protein
LRRLDALDGALLFWIQKAEPGPGSLISEPESNQINNKREDFSTNLQAQDAN